MNNATKILVIDDDPGSRRVVLSLLGADGNVMLEAPNGEEGLRIATEQHPDIVVLDVMMPGMDGYEVCKRLRSDSSLAAVPVLMLTALDDRESRLRGLESGADDFLNKPVDRTELRARVKTIARLNRFRLLVEESEKRKQLEAQLLRFQRLELMGQFAGGIVHDLNNVLSPITTGAYLLQGRVAPEDQQWLDAIENAAKRGADLVRQLLNFARGGVGEREPIVVASLLEEVRMLLDSLLDAKTSLKVEAMPGIPELRADRAQLHQVLMNLAVNARDAMADGGEIQISATHTRIEAAEAARMDPPASPGEYIVFSVADNGPGMSVEVQAKIFEPFFTTKPVGKGTGLGLPTVIRLVQAHGGFVSVRSAIGEGACFSCFFPVSSAEIQSQRA